MTIWQSIYKKKHSLEYSEELEKIQDHPMTNMTLVSFFNPEIPDYAT